MLTSSCVQELVERMYLIRDKAVESEAIVQRVTRDIQALDLAKKNISLSMTTLERLQMLGTLPSSSLGKS
jgi:hypothetical protein